MTTRRPRARRVTTAKAVRAIDAMVTLMQTGQVNAQEQVDLDRACAAIRAVCARVGVPL